MTGKTATAQTTPSASKPASGPVALLRAMGFSAVQVAPEIVALQTTVKKRAA